MALFALIAGIVVSNSDGISGALSHPSPEDAVRRAISAARRLALDSHGPASLRIVGGEFLITNHRGDLAAKLPAVSPNSNRMLSFIKDDGSRTEDAAIIPALHFGADGTTATARIRLADKATGKERTWRTDPFSAILTEIPPR